MKKFIFFFSISALICFAANAVEVELNGAGKVDITHGVVIVPEGTNIADGEYKVIIDGREITIIFTAGKGYIKQ
jgi:hypothetical protein